MEQYEITDKMSAIIALYCSRPGHASVPEVLNYMSVILWRRGITTTMPMYATARLLVLRDLLRVWEGE
jgi:hypothetical protein